MIKPQPELFRPLTRKEAEELWAMMQSARKLHAPRTPMRREMVDILWDLLMLSVETPYSLPL